MANEQAAAIEAVHPAVIAVYPAAGVEAIPLFPTITACGSLALLLLLTTCCIPRLALSILFGVITLFFKQSFGTSCSTFKVCNSQAAAVAL